MIEKIATFIAKAVLKTIRKTFRREIQAEVTVTEDDLWRLFQKYRKDSKMTGEEYILVGAFMRYLLIKLRLRK